MSTEEMAIKLAEQGKEMDSLKRRIDEMEEQTVTIHELVVSVKELAMNMQGMIKEQERYSKSQERAFQRIEVLEKRPIKHWDTMTTVIITALVSGIITYFISSLL